MRISSAHAFQTAIDNLSKRQNALVDAQDKLTTGKRVVTPGDDPAAAARAERALAQRMRAESDQRGLERARNVLQQSESALGDASELMQQARELIVSAGNGTYSDAERANMGDALRGVRSRLLALANRDDGAGQPLFGGAGAARTPFVDAPGGVRFDGQPGEVKVLAGEPLPVSLDGRAIFQSVPDRATGQDNLSMFDVLGRIAAELSTPGRDSAAISASVRGALDQIDASMDHIGKHRSLLGEALGRSDALEMRLSQRVATATNERSSAEDLDMVQAISDFQSQQTGYDAALRTYSMVQRMSLLDYLGR